MDFSFSELNYNSVETLSNLSARAAFQVNSSAVFKEDVDIVPVTIDDTLSYMPWGRRTTALRLFAYRQGVCR